mmetsp:Transcript_4740/g.6861  ORF Transcript_4740/g.6861 Transcript_4740/m.6861 type:complete len:328 (-) Transcript_4740:146-1129(-)|eukprot:CAMPEP_0194216666 /NCGR_PEP_ID=MMETSP0156-20130528/19471_1 /TAXON_ID=33649 /ORGANISM="Thalassionema nitzschioides, Strain L26-B" /LENGTH=327 /DNA_ID=CAMNT_0038945491 /DNA_START=100 /DNA_END=1080 /DNA_ORIENTATION=-
MDLLGDYGSDSELSLQDDGLKKNSRPEAISRNGKKLISLHSVLPSHIFERLVAGNSHMDSDDEDDELQRNVSREKMKLQPGTDKGLSSLLTELSSITKSKTAKRTLDGSGSKHEQMGQAFLKVESTVLTSNDKSNKEQVEKVHDTSSNNNFFDARLNVKSQKVKSVLKSRVNLAPYNADLRPQTWQNNVSEAQVSTSPTEHTKVPEDSSFGHTKISRREMEKSLRAGKLDIVDAYDGTRNIDDEAFVYVTEQNQPIGETGNGGIRVAPVAMYDTKSGKDVVGGISGKARGKNQINFLMASAAALEANKASQLKAKSYRVNAKRKYGW